MKNIFQKTAITTKYLISLVLLSISWFLTNLLWIAQKSAESGISAIDDTFLSLLINSAGIFILSLLLSWDLINTNEVIHKIFGTIFLLLSLFLFYFKLVGFGLLPWVL